MSDEAIAIAEVSRTVRTLVERFSDAVGTALEPWQKNRTAKADAKADVTRALGKSLASDIQRRGIQRFVTQSAYEQINIESILRKTIPMIKDKGRPKEIEQDWIINFIDKSKLISDEQMQLYWASVLAGETDTPGKFSKRTVNALASLDKSDAEKFSSLCNFNWIIGANQPLIFDHNNDIYKTNGVNFAILTHLDTIGLIKFDPLAGYVKDELPEKFVIQYHKTLLGVNLKQGSENKLNIGNAILTVVGRELATTIVPKQITDLPKYVEEYYKSKGVEIFDPKNRNSSILETNNN